jgi:BMFP domain-containing protein YqiC
MAAAARDHNQALEARIVALETAAKAKAGPKAKPTPGAPI